MPSDGGKPATGVGTNGTGKAAAHPQTMKTTRKAGQGDQQIRKHLLKMQPDHPQTKTDEHYDRKNKADKCNIGHDFLSEPQHHAKDVENDLGKQKNEVQYRQPHDQLNVPHE